MRGWKLRYIDSQMDFRFGPCVPLEEKLVTRMRDGIT